MKSISNILSEAIVSKGRKFSRNTMDRLPKDPTDVEGIIRWLTDRGFKDIGKPVHDDTMLTLSNPDAKFYSIGSHTETISRWIKVLLGKKLFFIRTIPEQKAQNLQHAIPYYIVDFSKSIRSKQQNQTSLYGVIRLELEREYSDWSNEHDYKK